MFGLSKQESESMFVSAYRADDMIAATSDLVHLLLTTTVDVSTLPDISAATKT
jgi:hypothetical protein